MGHFDSSLYSFLLTQRDQGDSPLKLPLAKTEVMEYHSMSESWKLACYVKSTLCEAITLRPNRTRDLQLVQG